MFMYCTVYCVKLPSPPSPSYVYLVLSCHQSQLMDRTQPDRKEAAAHANGAGLLWGAFVHRGFCFVQSRLVPLRICSRTISPPPTSRPFTVHLVPTIKLCTSLRFSFSSFCYEVWCCEFRATMATNEEKKQALDLFNSFDSGRFKEFVLEAGND